MITRRIWLALILLAAVNGIAQNRYGILRGNVRDSSNAPVKHATINITAASHERAYAHLQFVSDEHGDFRAVIEPGRYWIEVDAPGFRQAAEVVDFEAGQTTEKHFSLSKLAAEELSNPYRGQNEGTLSGTVFDPSKAAIQGATVLVQRNPAPSEKRTYPVFRIITDQAGKFEVPLVAGSYSVDVSGFIFVAQNTTVSVTPSSPSVRNFVLTLPPNLKGEEIFPPDEGLLPTPQLPDHIDPKLP